MSFKVFGILCASALGTFFLSQYLGKPAEVTAAVTAAYVALVYLQLREMADQRADQRMQEDQRRHREAERAQLRRGEVADAIRAELVEIRYRAALVAGMLIPRYGKATDEFLDWQIRIEELYEGILKEPGLLEALRRIRNCPESNRMAQNQSYYASKRDSAPELPKLSAVTIEGLVSEWVAFGAAYQIPIAEVLRQIHLFNHSAESVEFQFRKTFDSGLPEEVMANIRGNIESGCLKAGERARMLAEAATRAMEVAP